ncbi:DUF6493 family protein [Anatilimnocola floriformis]|uniref:DUF6493 family protein n=1 Tax=Anatilimnocola floriformis TaxID=2948575 RepID=UPI0020C45E17|nr:DUF6493 family protein [Anatilimnocola floriformis]
MTAEAFLECLDRKGRQQCTLDDAMQLAEIVATWTEAQRRKLSKTVVEMTRVGRDVGFYSSSAYHMLHLAVLAVGPLAAAKRVDSFYHFETAAIKILSDRRPDWLDQWVALQMSKKYPAISWWMFRELLRNGTCSKPSSDDYIRFLVSLSGDVDPYRPGPRDVPRGSFRRSEYLQQNPEFIEDLWRFFEIETSIFLTYFQPEVLTTNAADGNAPEGWCATLIRLGELGLMDRQRLLTATLRALGSSFSANALTSFARFFESLNATPEELAAAQTVFGELLANRASHVVKFSLEQLTNLQKLGLLDGPAFLAAAPAVFAVKPKGQPLMVLAIATKLAKDQPDLVPEIANLAIEALSHDSSDVQASALKMLAGWQARLHRDHASELQAKLPGIAASVRPRGEALIAALGVTAEDDSLPSPAPSISLEEFQSRASAVPERWLSASGFNAALTAATSDSCFTGASFNVSEISVLTSCAPIVPIETVDELLDAVAHALEELDSGDELERILDGISRLGSERPADFELRAKPLVQRLVANRRDNWRGLLGLGMHPKLPQLLLRWLGSPEVVQYKQMEDPRALPKFIERRLREIEARLAAGRSRSLLCAPTHQHGWLDPLVFVARLQATTTPRTADLLQALIRLAPDHRAAALESARDLPDDWGAAVRYALGGPPPTEFIESDERFSLWLAAGRSRQAFGPLTDLALAGGPSRETIIAEPTFAWQAIDRNPASRWSSTMTLKLSINPGLPRAEENALRPTLAIREDNLHNWANFGVEWSKAWLIPLWPANLDAVLAEGVRQLRVRIDEPASTFEPNYVYLQPLLRPDVSWSELSWLAIWLALLSKDSSSRGMAIDVLITGIEDGRAQLQFDVLAKLATGEWFKLNRLADAGREVARVSPRHAWWWAELLQRFLAQLATWPTEAHHLLTLLLELLSELQLSLNAEFRSTFESRTVTGKSAKVLKSILALQAKPNSAARQQAHSLALETALSRAERWAAGSL